jgi:hypothetical protein
MTPRDPHSIRIAAAAYHALGHSRLALSAALTAGAVTLGGLWSVLLGFAAACTVADALIPRASATAAEAEHRFDELVRRRRLAERLRTTAPLPVLDAVHPWTRTARRRELGVQSVAIASLAGTVEPLKARQFDREWRPQRSARERWKSLWLGRQSGSPIPPASVFRVNGTHWVRDGHHRASVAHHQHAPEIAADVVELIPSGGVRPATPAAAASPSVAVRPGPTAATGTHAAARASDAVECRAGRG